MCLAVPGRLAAWIDRDPLSARGWIEFGGVGRECHLACVPEAEVGDYVLVHAGVGIARIDRQEAEALIEELKRVGEHTIPPAATEDGK